MMLSKSIAVGAPQNRFAGPFRVGHQAGDVPLFVANARDIFHRTVRVGTLGDFTGGVRIAPQDLLVRVQSG